MAGRADHEGLPAHPGHDLCPRGLWSPRLPEVGEFPDLVNFHRRLLLAPLAAASLEPGDQPLRRGAGTGERSSMTAFLCRLRGMPPNLAIRGFLPGHSTLASKHVRGPCGVLIVALYLRAIFDTVESCLAASVLSIEVLATNSSRLSLQTSPASR